MNLITCALADVAHLFTRYHGYKSVGTLATYCHAVYENDRPVAAFVWNPPPPGACAALSAAPGGAGVLALSRMVAVPKDERRLQKISKPLRQIMRGGLIDRGRWPVLVTYSDTSLTGPSGRPHSGHVYLCSGWTRDGEVSRPFYETPTGERVSSYANGATDRTGKIRAGTTTLTRWVHRACPAGDEGAWLAAHGWRRETIPGKRWASGAPAQAWVRRDPHALTLF